MKLNNAIKLSIILKKCKNFIFKIIKKILLKSQLILMIITPVISVIYYENIKKGYNKNIDFILVSFMIFIFYILIIALYIMFGIMIREIKPKLPKPNKNFVHDGGEYLYIKDKEIPEIIDYLEKINKYFENK